MSETQNVEQKMILNYEQEIKDLKVNLKETKDTNKSLFKAIDEFKAQNKLDMKYIKTLVKKKEVLEKELAAKTTFQKSYEMPFVRVKVNKVLSDKYPKTDMSVSAGGALEQINEDDIASFIESISDRIALEMAEALKKLEPIQ